MPHWNWSISSSFLRLCLKIFIFHYKTEPFWFIQDFNIKHAHFYKSMLGFFFTFKTAGFKLERTHNVEDWSRYPTNPGVCFPGFETTSLARESALFAGLWQQLVLLWDTQGFKLSGLQESCLWAVKAESNSRSLDIVPRDPHQWILMGEIPPEPLGK